MRWSATPEPAVRAGDRAPVLQVRSLQLGHPGERLLFEHWSITLAAGVYWLGGESGSGKTTLLRWLAGELPGRGERLLGGRAMDDDAWRRAVCWVDAAGEAFDDLTPDALRAAVQRRHPQLDGAAWQRHVDGFGLAQHLGKTLHMLSTGMRRKAALAAALSAGATLTLLDEPTAGLDRPSTDYLVQALTAAGRQPGRALLVACGHWPEGLPRAGEFTLPER